MTIRVSRNRLAAAASLLLLVALPTNFSSADSNWPRWRGPDGTGHTQDANLPVRWDDNDVVWKTRLVGSGHSSPTVWGERIFLTAATEDGRRRHVLCLDRRGGTLLWERVAWEGEPESTHKMNMYASATCATDGQRVVAFFGRGGIHCYDLDGNRIWSRQLGQFENPWGTAASPILIGDLVIQNCDAEDDAYLVGLDKRTGETVWKTPREKLRGWSTPIVIDTGQRKEVVLNGHRGVNAYDPATGADLWFWEGDSGRGTPTVTRYGDLLIAIRGLSGSMCALRPGGSGAVNKTHEVWRTLRRGIRDLPSPIVVGKYLVIVSLRPGVATCYDAATGKELDNRRLEGSFCASPIAAGGLIFIPNDAGETFVLKPGEKLEVVARNRLTVGDDEIFRASLTPCDGQILCRSDKVLYCVGKRAMTSAGG